MLKISIELYLFYNFIRILETYALFLHLDSGHKARLSLSQRGFGVCIGINYTLYIINS